jgi:hypothetical protein
MKPEAPGTPVPTYLDQHMFILNVRRQNGFLKVGPCIRIGIIRFCLFLAENKDLGKQKKD